MSPLKGSPDGYFATSKIAPAPVSGTSNGRGIDGQVTLVKLMHWGTQNSTISRLA
jgi:hypothetical protein